jgi:hypothetical protein
LSPLPSILAIAVAACAVFRRVKLLSQERSVERPAPNHSLNRTARRRRWRAVRSRPVSLVR